MHFNIYIDDQLGVELKEFAKKNGKTRNALIREALSAWLHQASNSEWPAEVLDFKGVKEPIKFESYREQLRQPKEDPLE